LFEVLLCLRKYTIETAQVFLIFFFQVFIAFFFYTPNPKPETRNKKPETINQKR
jgi:hypothetical protein